MNTSLYAIQENYLRLASQLEESEGELTPELNDALVIHQEQRNEKAIAYMSVVKNYDAFQEACDLEIKRLQTAKKRAEMVSKKLKESLANATELFGNFQAGTFSFSVRRTKSVNIFDEDSLPAMYKKTKVETVPDKTKIKEAIEAGATVPGATLNENKSLIVK